MITAYYIMQDLRKASSMPDFTGFPFMQIITNALVINANKSTNVFRD